MSTENIEPSLTADSGSGAANSPGAMIREARTRLRMTIEELAAATKLARHTLDALERDDFNALQEAVYVRGYYRKCAKILQINETRLVEAYQGRVVPKRPDAPSKLRLASGTDIGAVNPLPVPMAVASAVGAVIIGILLWNLFKSPETPQAQPAAEQNIEVEQLGSPEPLTPAPAADATAGLPTELGTEPPVDPAATATAPAPVGASSAPLTQAPVAPGVAQAVASTTTPAVPTSSLTLSFTSTSWARVEDASGKALLNRLMQDDESQVLRGQAPFTVFLGNGPGVRIEYAGKTVDFSRHVTDNLTARFQVPEAGN